MLNSFFPHNDVAWWWKASVPQLALEAFAHQCCVFPARKCEQPADRLALALMRPWIELYSRSSCLWCDELVTLGVSAMASTVLCCLCAPCASGLGQVIVSCTSIPTEGPESFYLILESFSEKTSGNSSNSCLSETLLISFFKVWVISPLTEHEIKSRHTKRQMEMINKSQYLYCGLYNPILPSASY